MKKENPMKNENPNVLKKIRGIDHLSTLEKKNVTPELARAFHDMPPVPPTDRPIRPERLNKLQRAIMTGTTPSTGHNVTVRKPTMSTV